MSTESTLYTAMPEQLSHEAQPSAECSRGSAEHGTGECKPCAWFWKSQGCQNGQDCGFCHLCPREEIKTRRRAKVTAARADDASTHNGSSLTAPAQGHLPSAQCLNTALPPMFLPAPPVRPPMFPAPPVRLPAVLPPVLPPSPIALLPAVLPPPPFAPMHLLPPTLPPAPTSFPVIESGLAPSTIDASTCVEPLAEVKLFSCQSAPTTPRSVGLPIHAPLAPPPSPAPLLLEGKLSDTLVTPPLSPAPVLGGSKLSDTLVVPPPPGLSLPPCLPSLGSIHHGTGRCKPCGWFWKAEGCANGSECCHCHLCPHGEIRARRRAKIALMRQQNTSETTEHMHSEEGTSSNEQQLQDDEGDASSVKPLQLPRLLGRMRPAPLIESAELQVPKLVGHLQPAPLLESKVSSDSRQNQVPIKRMPDQSTAQILKLSDRV